MNEDKINDLPGIGNKTTALLHKKGIFTIHDLANCTAQIPSIPNLDKFIMTAKDYLKMPIISQTKAEKQLPTVVDSNMYKIKSHSWYEKKIILPVIEKNNKIENVYAIVYEMIISPYERIALICQTIKIGEDVDTLTIHSYSPQYIANFNSKLPELTCNIHSIDMKLLPNQDTLNNVLLETNRIIIVNHALMLK